MVGYLSKERLDGLDMHLEWENKKCIHSILL
jgi:hypothetical protein